MVSLRKQIPKFFFKAFHCVASQPQKFVIFLILFVFLAMAASQYVADQGDRGQSVNSPFESIRQGLKGQIYQDASGFIRIEQGAEGQAIYMDGQWIKQTPSGQLVWDPYGLQWVRQGLSGQYVNTPWGSSDQGQLGQQVAGPGPIVSK